MTGLTGVTGVVFNIFKPIASLIETHMNNETERELALTELNKIQLEMTLKLKEYEEMRESDIIEAQRQNLQVELSGRWYQRNWRPTFSWAMILIIINNYIIYPYVSLFTDAVILLDIPDGLWNLFVVAFGGYTIGRSAEKIFDRHSLKSKDDDIPRAIPVNHNNS